MYPDPYLRYLYLFHCTRDFFECHEVMEEYWKSRGLKRDVWLALVQLAVTMYHYRRENYSGALKMMTSAYPLFEKVDLSETGIDRAELLQRINRQMKMIEGRIPYRPNAPFLIPFLDPELTRWVMENCSKLKDSGEENEMREEILHKHKVLFENKRGKKES